MIKLRLVIAKLTFIFSCFAYGNPDVFLKSYFDATNIEAQEIFIDYDLTKADVLSVGHFQFSKETIYVDHGPLKGNKAFKLKLDQPEASQNSFLTLFLPDIFRSEYLEVQAISSSGKLIWEKEIKTSDNDLIRDLYFERLNNSANLIILPANEFSKFPLDFTQEAFRFCIIKEDNSYQTNLCTGFYGVKAEQKKILKARSKGRARVISESKLQPSKGLLKVVKDSTIGFYGETENGESLQFVTLVKWPDITDLYINDKNQIVLETLDFPLLGENLLTNSEELKSFKIKVGFDETMKPTRSSWINWPNQENQIHFSSPQGGGIFTFKLDPKKILKGNDRLKLDSVNVDSTYSEDFKVYGLNNNFLDFKVEQGEFDSEVGPDANFIWNLKELEMNKINSRLLFAKKNVNEFRYYYKVYRGFANEISGRLSGILTAQSLVFNAEINYQHWFENLFGWNNYWLGRQRWGINYRFFKSITQNKTISADSTYSTSAFTTSTLDLKYRFKPGVWGFDEVFGLIISHQDLAYGEGKVKALGGGFFWGRSMPAFVDQIFNLVPLLRYPKWVDMEILTYPNSLDSNSIILYNYSINFHGKVMWTPNFYGEAGFGRKDFNFQDTKALTDSRLQTFYGTAGLGYNF